MAQRFSIRRFCFALLAAFALAAPARAQEPFATTAAHVAILDGESGALLYCQDCDVAMPPASMSKLMTLLIVAEALHASRITMDTTFPVSERAWRHGAMSGGSHMFLELNSTVSVRDLLTGLVVVSANDACIALAEGVGGTEAAFIATMNRRAQELGLRSAHFANVTGLDDPSHVISAADLGRLARHIIRTYPELYRLYSMRDFTYNNRTQQNRNPLLGAYPGADGVKTGNTDLSGYGMVGSAVRGNQRRIIVFNGMRSMAERRAEAIRLMDAAFTQFALTRVAAAGEQVGEAEVWLGSRRTVPLVAKRDIIVGGTQAIQNGLSAHIVYDGPIHAPITEGAVVAHLVIEGPGFQTQRFELTAGRKIGRANPFARAWTGLTRTLFGGS
jgi:serine-type D-Ala-D-Ala carboxypeptidase (penicillin-binding protein 5/6)